ncbi:MAG: helix-turn-helix domain-containing protein [Deltaproteobacteria bacterium]|nr:helix-turn-helix domain-containing protein [Deltaproteobacteria bacterium]
MEYIKSQTIGEFVRIDLRATVPAQKAALATKALKSVLALAMQGARPVNEDGEQLYTFEEVFPEAYPGMAVRGYRGKMDMTRQELAERLGIKQTRVSELESGKRAISKEMAKRLGKIFDISSKAFL